MRLVDLDKVKYVLEETAKYYEMDNADEWTKGIHYGLLHGLDNILDDVKEVEAISKDQYEARLKADMAAMLSEIQLEIREHDPGCGWEGYADKNVIDCIIQEKINSLEGE